MAEKPRRPRRCLGRLLALSVESFHPGASLPGAARGRPQTLFSYRNAPWKPDVEGSCGVCRHDPVARNHLRRWPNHFRACCRGCWTTPARRCAPRAWPFRPYELARKCQSYLAQKYSLAVDAALQNAEITALWHLLLWRWGKRIARLRGLVGRGPKRAARDHERPRHRGLRRRGGIAQGAPGWDRPGLRRYEVRCLRAHGSIFSTPAGFRCRSPILSRSMAACPSASFECAACAVPLLSDHRSELAEIFPGDLSVSPSRSQRGWPGGSGGAADGHARPRAARPGPRVAPALSVRPHLGGALERDCTQSGSARGDHPAFERHVETVRATKPSRWRRSLDHPRPTAHNRRRGGSCFSRRRKMCRGRPSCC